MHLYIRNIIYKAKNFYAPLNYKLSLTMINIAKTIHFKNYQLSFMRLLNTKYVITTFFIIFSFTIKVNAQTLKLIPNPDSASVGFSGNWSRTFNGKFYLPYKNASGKYQLAQFDGATTILHDNPDNGTIDFADGSFVYNNSLLFFYNDGAGKNRLAKFDGNGVSLINNPDDGSGFKVDFLYKSDSNIVSYKNQLYNIYINAKGKGQLAKFDGVSITLINLGDSTAQINTNTQNLAVNNNILYFGVSKNNKSGLAKYDGNSVTIINNPDNGSGIANKLLFFNNEVCFFYDTSHYSFNMQFAKYDGNKISIIPDSAGKGFNYHVHYNPVVYKNELYLLYGQDDIQKYLAKYDGKKITVLNNPSATGYFIDLVSPIVWHNKLYCSYLEFDTTYGYIPLVGRIAVYDGDKVNVLNNPDNGLGFGLDSVNYSGGSGESKESNFQLIDYNDTLFASYYKNSNERLALSKFDGSNFTLYNSQNINDKGVVNLKIVNNKLFVVHQNKFGKYQIGQYAGTGQGLSVFNNPDTGTITNFPVVNSINNYVYLTYQNAFGRFQIATLDTSKTLPVSILSFTAKPNNKTIQTNWQSSTEQNTNHFIIQHCTDGSSFTDIGTVKAIGSGANGYQFTDNSPTNGINYYRLKSVDKDGSFSYSKVVSVQFTVNSNQLAVFPNPTKDKVTVRGNHIAAVQVVDNMGRVIKTVSFKDASNPVLTLTGIATGIYHLRVQTTDGKVSGANLVVN